MNKRIRVNGVIYEAVKSRRINEEYEPAFSIPSPKVDSNWTISSDYDEPDATMVSKFSCVYRDLPITFDFDVTTWHYSDESKASEQLMHIHTNPWISFQLVIGEWNTRVSNRAVANDTDGSRSSRVISDILTDIESSLDRVIEVASNPKYTLLPTSERSGKLKKVVKSALDDAEDLFDRNTIDRF